jgi:hypothetical protein
MSCRTVKVKITEVNYPEGGASHGPTCCICLRGLPNPHYRVELKEPSHPFSISRTVFERLFHREYSPQSRPRIGWGFRVCSKNCSRVMALWLDVSSAWEVIAPHRNFYISLCLAHSCHKVLEVE